VRRRLVATFVLVALAVAAVLGVPRAFQLQGLVRVEAAERLQREAQLIGTLLGPQLQTGTPVLPEQLGQFLLPDHRAVLVDRLGRRVDAGTPLSGPAFGIRADLGGGALLSLAIPQSEIDRRVRGELLRLLATVGASLALAAVLALLLARRLSRPFVELARVSEELGYGNFEMRAPVADIEEAAAISEALNRSAERIDALLRREREFTSNVSHQLRSPLTALQLRLEELQAWPGLDDAGRREVTVALEQARRIGDTVTNLLGLAQRGTAGDRVVADVSTTIEHARRRWEPVYRVAGRELAVTAEPALHAVTVPASLDQSLDILLDNALQHGGARAAVHAERIDSLVRVRVTDDGPGIDPQLASRVFERHVSGGGGQGIGLALARTLMNAAGGRITLSQVQPATFDVYLPTPDAPAPDVPDPPPPAG
jgi:signal transduction histidine kinase